MQTTVSPASASPTTVNPSTFPVQRSFGAANDPIHSLSQTSDSPGTSKNRPRALVVDDVQDVIEMLALFLKHAGYEVATASSGPDALEVARAERFDVIVSDIGMPGMNGYELAQALRSLPQCSTVPMIAVTGFSMYDDSRRALECGFNAHLTKPINPMALLELIERLRD